ncbi:MAG: hypothetical protein HY535_08435 [Chloroflexi bacterium]|nr:hypothetical protein [Chloroflexota bacterium]
MESTYEPGTLLWYWFESRLVLAGCFLALVLLVFVGFRTSWDTRSRELQFMVVAVLAALPLSLKRLGLEVVVVNDLTAGYLSWAGVAGSLLLALPYLFGMGYIRDKEWMARVLYRIEVAQTVWDHFNQTMAQSNLKALMEDAVREQKKATCRLVLERLPTALWALRANPEPKSAAGRKAKRELEKGLLLSMNAAKLGDRFMEDAKRLVDHVRAYLVPARVAEAKVARYQARLSARLALASRSMAAAESYLASQRGAQASS